MTGIIGDFAAARELSGKPGVTLHPLYRKKVPKVDALWITIEAVSLAYR
jgi:hypothetical protein